MAGRTDEQLAQRLLGELGGVPVSSDVAGYQIDGLVPKVVVSPQDPQNLSHVVASASAEELALAPWGGGTRVALGNLPERLDIVVDLSGLDKVVAHTPADLTATVEAGITVAELQKLLGEHGQFVALDPPLPDRATVGGTLAAGTSGPLKWQFWDPRDIVIGTKVVQADGKITKSGGQVVKNVSGYDMGKLHIGGLGTLGIISEVSLKLTPLPRGQATVVAAYKTSRGCIGAALEIFRSDVVPLALVVFDRQANDQMEATGLTGGRFLAARFGGRPRTLERQVQECRSVCQQHGPSSVDVLDEGEAQTLWRSVADFGWDDTTRPAVGGRASVQPSKVLALTEALESGGSPDGLRPAVLSHPAHGTVLAAWYPEGPGIEDDDAAELLRTAREAAHQAGGHMLIEHCPPSVKPRFDVYDWIGEPMHIMRRLKEEYDPKRALNPGRFAGGI